MAARLLRLSIVMDRTGLGRSSIYQKMTEGSFPKPVPVGPRGRRWASEEIDDWISARIAERDGVEA